MDPNLESLGINGFPGTKALSSDWSKGKLTGKSHISLENLWFPVDFPLSQRIEENDQKRQLGLT